MLANDSKEIDGVFNTMIKIIVVTLICFVFVNATASVSKHFNAKPDNQLEELLEEAIESQTGISLDLTPDSIEG